ncbi:glycine cleavage system protein GcvH [Candidatus Sororendozoicomonas aggregata]|uniref:glycine cleavage system protein GcvH n=1 Tax=Candidatus Sororendozoicomonas aggregata TaxID=3073239 RepID=UPI002ED17240
MNNIENLKFTDTHEWVLDNGDGTVTVGITEHAQEQLGDVVFVELPEIGQEVGTGDDLSLVESVKAASDIYAPVSGEIVEVNTALEEAPETINLSAFEDGWIVKVKLSEPAELDDLMSASAYQASIE